MNRFLGIFAVLLILTFSSMAQDNARTAIKFLWHGKSRLRLATLRPATHLAGSDRSKLTAPESTEMVAIDHQRNVSNCRAGLQPCDRSRLSGAERTALAVANHQDNVSACNNGIHSWTNHNSPTRSAQAAVAGHLPTSPSAGRHRLLQTSQPSPSPKPSRCAPRSICAIRATVAMGWAMRHFQADSIGGEGCRIRRTPAQCQQLQEWMERLQALNTDQIGSAGGGIGRT